jgi:hypothetical protein
MLNDLTSGFNIAANLTLSKKYNEMFGFTGEEVHGIATASKIDLSKTTIDMQQYYDGYLFNEDAEHHLYNPSMMMMFFSGIEREGYRPKVVIDENLKTDYSRIKHLMTNDCNKETLLQIAKDGGIAANIKESFSMESMRRNEYFISLLFYMGLLTISKAEFGITFLKIPNYSIQTLYWDYITNSLKDDNARIFENHQMLHVAIKEMGINGDIEPFIAYISNNVLKKLSNRDLINFDEKYIKLLLLAHLFQSNFYRPVSEKEVDNGYIDLFAELSPGIQEDFFEWALEIKYLKKSDAEKLPQKEAEARAQLEKYKASAFLHGRKVKYAALIFIGKDMHQALV